MKRILPILVLLSLLTACSPARVSDADMATRVAAILTSQPSETPKAVSDVATAQAPAPSRAAQEANATPTQAATLAPSATTAPTATPEATEAPTETLTSEPSATPTGPTPTPPATLAPSFTPPATDPVTRLGTPTSTDNMDKSDTWLWPTGKDFKGFTNVEFKDGVMLLTGLQKDKGGWRLSTAKSMENFYIEMAARMDKCQPSDKFGIIFRVPVLNEADRGYLFGITCDGKYYLRKWDGKVEPNGLSTTFIAPKASTAIQTGSNFNRLGVMAVGKEFWLYVNGVLVDKYSDASYNSGYFGVFVTPVQTENLTVRVDQMSYWLNPKP